MTSPLSIRTKHTWLVSTFVLALAGQAQGQEAPTTAPATAEAPTTVEAPAAIATPAPEAATEPAVQAVRPAETETPAAVPAPAAAQPTVSITTVPAPTPEPAAAVPETVEAAPAPAAPPLKVGGTFMTRYEARAGELPVIGNRPLNADALFYRARLSLMPAPVEFGESMSSTVYFEPQASGSYMVGGDLTDISLGLHQGYLRLMSPCYTLDVGRFEMIYGEHLMIGNVAWNETGRAFNGGRVHITPRGADGPWVDVFATLNNDGKDVQASIADRNIGSLDHYFVGAYAGLGSLVGPEFDLYVLSKLWMGGTAPTAEGGNQSVDPAAQVTFGARLKGDAGLVDYRAEAGVQFGARKSPTPELPAEAAAPKSVFAYQADAELGLKPAKGLRLSAHGFIASGDDASTTDTVEAWDQHYPTAHKFLGLTDVFGGRSNVIGAALHGSLAFAEQFKATLDGHMFNRLETPEGTDGYAGSEVDVGLAYALAPSTSFRGLYGVFMPSEDGSFGIDLPQHFVEIELLHTLQ